MSALSARWAVSSMRKGACVTSAQYHVWINTYCATVRGLHHGPTHSPHRLRGGYCSIHSTGECTETHRGTQMPTEVTQLESGEQRSSSISHFTTRKAGQVGASHVIEEEAEASGNEATPHSSSGKAAGCLPQTEPCAPPPALASAPPWLHAAPQQRSPLTSPALPPLPGDCCGAGIQCKGVTTSRLLEDLFQKGPP